MSSGIKIKESDIHPHIKGRMLQRGISLAELEETVNKGWAAGDAAEGTTGKIFIFPYNAEWEGKFFEEKEVTVYYKYKIQKLVLLTAKARYGKFLRKEKE
jgi:hypothetical protein